MSTNLVLLAVLMFAATYPWRAVGLLSPGVDRLPTFAFDYLQLVGPAVLTALAAVSVMVVVGADDRPTFHVGVEWLAVGACLRDRGPLPEPAARAGRGGGDRDDCPRCRDRRATGLTWRSISNASTTLAEHSCAARWARAIWPFALEEPAELREQARALDQLAARTRWR